MKKIAHLTAVAALVWASAAISENAGGAVYDAVADFNATGLQAPGDTWTYGAVTTLGGALSYLPKFGSVTCGGANLPSDCQPSGVIMLSYFTSAPVSNPGASLMINTSGGAITYTKGAPQVDNDVVFPTGVLMMSPSGELQTVRWTAPSTGTFDVAGFFMDLQRANLGLDVVVDGVQMFTSSFSGATTLQGKIPFSLTGLLLAAGDTIDFVADGTVGSTDDDLVGLSATVSQVAVPEPSTLAIFGAGLGGLIFIRRRQNPSTCQSCSGHPRLS
jgi:hypothetical protein